jgi:primase-polymerase (primpol)-like protein
VTAPQTILQHKKPESLPVVSDGIPGELKTYHTWVLWKLARVGDDWTKHPYGVGTGRRASSTDSRTWSSYKEVLAAYEAGGYDGIGFVLSTGDPYCGVDLDNAVNPETGEVAGWAQTIIEGLEGYTELSPSGTGIHIIVRGELPGKGNRKGSLEMYDKKRFFTVTGHRLGGTS